MNPQVWMTATGELFVLYERICILIGDNDQWIYDLKFLGCEYLGEL